MKHYKRFFLWLIPLLLCYVWGARLLRATPRAIPLLRLVYGEKGIPVDTVSQVGIPNKGYLHAAVATDEFGGFYLLSVKKNLSLKVLEVPASVAPNNLIAYRQKQQNVVHVLVVGSDGQMKRAIPLRRLDGRLVRGDCEFLAVSPSGNRWWTLRQAHESPEDWKDRRDVKKRTVLLNAYNNQGKPLAEWEVPLPLAIETFAVAAAETKAYVVPEILEQEKQLLIYKIESKQPKKHPWPDLWSPGIGWSLITANGQFWHLRRQNDNEIAAYVTELEKPSRVFTTFQWHRERFSPFLFWQDAQAGLFVFENLKDEKGQLRWADGAKAVYRITPDGTVHKLFETPDVLHDKPDQQVRAGQLLKADANFVWMEVSYLKEGKVTEYQIVKVSYR